MSLLEWLLIRTPDGATYLQAIIMLTVLFLFIVYAILPSIKDVKTTMEDIKNDCIKSCDEE